MISNGYDRQWHDELAANRGGRRPVAHGFPCCRGGRVGLCSGRTWREVRASRWHLLIDLEVGMVVANLNPKRVVMGSALRMCFTGEERERVETGNLMLLLLLASFIQ